MWFKYFNRSSWAMRIFRTRNLKYSADDFGCLKYHYASKFKNLSTKVFGNDVALRTFYFIWFFSLCSIYGFYDQFYNGEENERLAKLAYEENQRKELIELEEIFTKNRLARIEFILSTSF